MFQKGVAYVTFRGLGARPGKSFTWNIGRVVEGTDLTSNMFHVKQISLRTFHCCINIFMYDMLLYTPIYKVKVQLFLGDNLLNPVLTRPGLQQLLHLVQVGVQPPHLACECSSQQAQLLAGLFPCLKLGSCLG